MEIFTKKVIYFKQIFGLQEIVSAENKFRIEERKFFKLSEYLPQKSIILFRLRDIVR